MKKIGKYEVTAELGRGSMGMVYRAHDTILDRPVALKVVAADLLSKADTFARFQREARSAARLAHPNIVTVYELGEVEDALFIAMEFLEGEDLAQLMAHPARLPLDEKLRIIVEVCRGLEFAHKAGVIHRDVKPANIRVLKDGTVKIVDFGVAHLIGSSLTRAGEVLGTPSYMAPEMLSQAKVDHRADIWAVGVILFELIAGRKPFDAPTVVGLIQKIIHDTLPPLDVRSLALPPALSTIVQRALAKMPEDRYQEAAELADAIVAIRRKASAASSHETIPRDITENMTRDEDDVATLIMDVSPTVLMSPTVMEKYKQSAAPATVKVAPSAAPPEPARADSLRGRIRRDGLGCLRSEGVFGEPQNSKVAALSPSVAALAIGGADGAIRIWNVQSRTRVTTLRTALHQRSGHDASALALAYSPDGNWLASGHVDGAVHLWDMRIYRESRSPMRHESAVTAVAFSPDGQLIATGGMDASLKIWDRESAATGEPRRTLLRQPAAVACVRFVRSGSAVMTGHTNRIARILDLKTSRLSATLRGPEGSIHQLAVAPGGQYLALASQDRSVRLILADTLETLWMTDVARRAVSTLEFIDDEILIGVNGDHAVTLGMRPTGPCSHRSGAKRGRPASPPVAWTPRSGRRWPMVVFVSGLAVD
ncbi:MAG: serine/threonine protein kinase, partial [Vicinamibacteria bacterium]|nr:serine/threonine protein kinase [Vicinamibacteria bacterium]